MDYKCIVFDEVFMCDIEQLQMIHRFITANENNIKFLATGDTDQLGSLSNYGFNNVADIKNVQVKLSMFYFPIKLSSK